MEGQCLELMIQMVEDLDEAWTCDGGEGRGLECEVALREEK